MNLDKQREDTEKILGVPVTTEYINPQFPNHDHQNYQRFTIESKVEEKMKHWDSKPKPGVLARRSDGSLWTIDGQHHTEAARRLGVPQIPYFIFASNGPEFETEIYTKFQTWQYERG